MILIHAESTGTRELFMRSVTRVFLSSVLAIGLAACEASEDRVNVYSARHYDADNALYAQFEAQTGIKVYRIEASGDLLMERIRAEAESSPADVIITVDAGRLWRIEEAGLFQPAGSAVLDARVPERLRHPDGLWYSITRRARVIAFAPDRISADQVDTYEKLADPGLRGRVCVRSSGNIYNLSLLAALIERWGPARAETWAAGVAANFARAPQGGDTDQIRAVAAGVCDVALVNHYYYARLAASDKPADREVAAATRIVWPDQQGDGVHVNVSGVGMAANAPHPDNARRLLEFLVAAPQQTLLASANNEYPAAEAPLDNPALEALGDFREEPLNVRVYGERQAEAAAMFDRIGWP